MVNIAQAGATGLTPTSAVTAPVTIQESVVPIVTKVPIQILSHSVASKAALEVMTQTNTNLLSQKKVNPTNPFSHIAKVSTPVKVDRLAKLLEGYDPNKTAYLISGFKFGFDLERDEFSLCSVHNNSYSDSTEVLHFNHDSALCHPEVIAEYLHVESEAGLLAGPFKSLPLPGFQDSPIALVEKKTKGKYWLIHNVSFLDGKSVND